MEVHLWFLLIGIPLNVLAALVIGTAVVLPGLAFLGQTIRLRKSQRTVVQLQEELRQVRSTGSGLPQKIQEGYPDRDAEYSEHTKVVQELLSVHDETPQESFYTQDIFHDYNYSCLPASASPRAMNQNPTSSSNAAKMTAGVTHDQGDGRKEAKNLTTNLMAVTTTMSNSSDAIDIIIVANSFPSGTAIHKEVESDGSLIFRFRVARIVYGAIGNRNWHGPPHLERVPKRTPESKPITAATRPATTRLFSKLL